MTQTLKEQALLIAQPVEELQIVSSYNFNNKTIVTLNDSFKVATLVRSPYRRRQVYAFRQEVKRRTRKNYFKSSPYCMYCKINQGTVLDHIIPVCSGGNNSPYNIAVACTHCDSVKKSFTPREIGWTVKPTRKYMKEQSRMYKRSFSREIEYINGLKMKNPEINYPDLKTLFTPIKVVNNKGERIKIVNFESDKRQVKFVTDTTDGHLIKEIHKSNQTTFGFIKSSLMIKNFSLMIE